MYIFSFSVITRLHRITEIQIKTKDAYKINLYLHNTMQAHTHMITYTS